ncbi:hypothetical protein VSS74_04855 [Conexibacter stalactiti]|uniref:DUF4349 domain-containing protein n=1 Tax=Conexibacter stalactiti TaxID=1940611 RepID=A0ABU4HK15_9ACTN|nr:hypothetical protein [Conexibacter stalactiti]MDW5593653.1 hypothetical protein [Conexibacter stalactiti]MEC5034294.1 hypothetical protein [Conexibacter stalactiti]
MSDRFPRRTAQAVVLCAAAVLLLAFFVELLPRLTRDQRGIASTPVPTGARNATTLPLEPGQRVCLDGVVVSPDSEVLQLMLDPAEPLPAPPLRVTVNGIGYDAAATVRADEHTLRVPLDPPDETLAAAVCVANRGRRTATLAATADPRVLQRTRATPYGGYPLAVAFQATFTEAEPRSMLGSLDTTAERAATFNALGPWALWLLLPLLGLGVPALLLGAYYLALRRPGGSDDDAGT